MRFSGMGHLQFVRKGKGKGNGFWRVRVMVPKPLRAIVGQLFGKPALATLTRALGTANEAEAQQLSVPVLAEFQAIIADASLGYVYHDAEPYQPFSSRISRRLRPELHRLPKMPPNTAAPAKIETVTFESIIDSWELENTHPAGRRNMRRNMSKLAAFLSHDDAARVTPKNLVDWKESLLRSDLSPKSVQNHMTSIKTLFKFAAPHKIASNPAADVTYRAKKISLAMASAIRMTRQNGSSRRP